MICLFLHTTAEAEIVTRYYTVVDTVNAMRQMREKKDVINAPVKAQIDDIQKEIKENAKKLAETEDSMSFLNSLKDDYAPKVVDNSYNQKMTEFLVESMSKVPMDAFLGFCNPKDVEKARKKDNIGALEELRRKVAEKTLKKAEKGDYVSGVAEGVLNFFCDQTLTTKKKLSNEESELNKKKKKLEDRIEKAPETFTISAWRNDMTGIEVPTKVIKVRKERRGPDDLSFDELRHEYDIPLYRDAWEKFDSAGYFPRLFVEGKFDGIIKDRLGIFPVKSSKIEPEGENVDNPYEIFGKFIIVSENSPIENAEKDYNVYLCNSAEFPGCGFSLEPLNELWSINGNEERRDGFILSLNPLESSITEQYTYVLENGKWVNKSPFDPRYLSFDECLQIMKNEGGKPKITEFSFRLNDAVDENDVNTDSISKTTVELMLVGDSSLGLEGNGIYVKTISRKKGEEENSKFSLQALRFDSEDFYSMVIKKDYFASGDDALVIYYQNNANPSELRVEFYKYGWNGPEVSFMNGLEILTEGKWIKALEGVYDKLTDEYDLRKLEDDKSSEE